ncbi:tetratricopeptide repeat protein [Neisseriaceae bacterium ESL0693]|nr:tetratricopeptide repeat protein [Neisseriaceae bacterium ESL0693]
MTAVQHYGGFSLMIISGFFLSGCYAFNQPASAPTTYQTISQTRTMPVNEHIALLEKQLIMLETQLNNLQNQVDHIDHQQIALTQLFNLQTTSKLTGLSDGKTNSKDNKTEQARQLYRAGLYSQVIKLLKKADHPADNSASAQEQMWLLLQSHARLNNCESVINMSQRFTSQFGRHPEAPHALYLMAQCQQRMQQEDIARTTYQRIISHYPHSVFAKKARQKLSS